jgi:hypothetical protein
MDNKKLLREAISIASLEKQGFNADVLKGQAVASILADGDIATLPDNALEALAKLAPLYTAMIQHHMQLLGPPTQPSTDRT